MRRHLLFADDVEIAREGTLEGALRAFETDLQLYVSRSAPRHVFVHAGVVGWKGRAILLPGRTLAGKTSLVIALVKAGATYYSDEFAVLDARGRVHPYARKLHVRGRRVRADRRPVAEFGGTAGEKPLRVGLIVATQFKEGARWRPRRLTRAESIVELLANTVPARLRPAAAMKALQAAVADADGLAGTRADAEPAAKAILAALGDP